MNRSDIARYIAKMGENMASHGRGFTYEMPPPASVEQLEAIEVKSGIELPAALREFFQEADGLVCTSVASDENAEILRVPTFAQVVEYSVNINRSVIDMREDLEGIASAYIVCGLYLDETFVIRHGEQSVLLFDVWVEDGNWLTVASSFEEWLTRSFESMASTANGFRFFEPIRPLW